MSSRLAWLRDELGIEVDADAVGARIQSPVRVGVGDGVGIGIEGVTEIGSSRARHRSRSVGRLQMRMLLRKVINGSLMRLAVEARVGEGVEPDLGGGLDSADMGGC
jgi:hypothetical protein